jgi:hypothetical protein
MSDTATDTRWGDLMERILDDKPPLDEFEEKRLAVLAMRWRLASISESIQLFLAGTRLVDLAGAMDLYAEMAEHYTLGKVKSGVVYVWLVTKLSPLTGDKEAGPRVARILARGVDRLAEVMCE